MLGSRLLQSWRLKTLLVSRLLHLRLKRWHIWPLCELLATMVPPSGANCRQQSKPWLTQRLRQRLGS